MSRASTNCGVLRRCVWATMYARRVSAPIRRRWHAAQYWVARGNRAHCPTRSRSFFELDYTQNACFGLGIRVQVRNRCVFTPARVELTASKRQAQDAAALRRLTINQVYTFSKLHL